MTVRFTQSCPTCGRRIQIRAALMGCTVACQHCQAEFVAQDESAGAMPKLTSATQMEAEDPLMARVEQALRRAEQGQTAVS